MLELARQLAAFDQQHFNKWLIAGAQINIHGVSERFERRVLFQKATFSVLEVNGYTDAKLCKSLRVTLVKPKTVQPVHNSTLPTGSKLLLQHSFSKAEIAAYLAASGDRNSIHRGERPLVPGFCLLAWLKNALSLTELAWQVRFLAPLYADESAAFSFTANSCVATSGSRLLLKIKM